jgi:hypothetical protein
MLSRLAGVTEVRACREIPSAVGRDLENAVNRLTAALIAYAVLAGLAWATITDHRIRGITLAILAMFAAKSWVRRKEVMHPDGDGESK